MHLGGPLPKAPAAPDMLTEFREDRATMSVKNTAEAVSELKQRLPEHAAIAPYLNKRLWVRVLLDGLADDEVYELIEDSYDLVVATLPRALRPS